MKEHGIDLTELAKKGSLDPVIGREEEIKRTVQILSRRTKVRTASRQGPSRQYAELTLSFLT